MPRNDEYIKIKFSANREQAEFIIDDVSVAKITYPSYKDSIATYAVALVFTSTMEQITIKDGYTYESVAKIKNWFVTGGTSIPEIKNIATEDHILWHLNEDDIESPNVFDSVKLINRSYEIDTVDVKYRRISLNDILAFNVGDFSWYDSDEWDQARDIPLAISTLTDKLTSTGINVDGNIRTLKVERYRDGEHWYLKYTFDSLVFADGDHAIFKLPHQFSDSVTVKALNGFIYTPIDISLVIE